MEYIDIFQLLFSFSYFFSGFLSMQMVSSIIEKCFTKYMFKVYKQSLQQKQSSLWNMFKVNRMTPVTSNGVSIVDFKTSAWFSVWQVICWKVIQCPGRTILHWLNYLHHLFSKLTFIFFPVHNLSTFSQGYRYVYSNSSRPFSLLKVSPT